MFERWLGIGDGVGERILVLVEGWLALLETGLGNCMRGREVFSEINADNLLRQHVLCKGIVQ